MRQLTFSSMLYIIFTFSEHYLFANFDLHRWQPEKGRARQVRMLCVLTVMILQWQMYEVEAFNPFLTLNMMYLFYDPKLRNTTNTNTYIKQSPHPLSHRRLQQTMPSALAMPSPLESWSKQNLPVFSQQQVHPSPCSISQKS